MCVCFCLFVCILFGGYYRDWEYTIEEPPKHLHFVESFLTAQLSEGREVGLIVDLCNHECLYHDEIPEGVEYAHIWCVAKTVPGDDDIQNFVQAVDTYLEKNPKKYVAVHCSYGFNRTGFMICCYLIEKMNLSIEEALQVFSDSRPPGIKHEKFMNELRLRYGPQTDLSNHSFSSAEKQQMEESLISLDVTSGQDLLKKLEEFKNSNDGERKIYKVASSAGSLDSLGSAFSLEEYEKEIMEECSTPKKKKRCVIM